MNKLQTQRLDDLRINSILLQNNEIQAKIELMNADLRIKQEQLHQLRLERKPVVSSSLSRRRKK
jgi:hypothetical protein